MVNTIRRSLVALMLVATIGTTALAKRAPRGPATGLHGIAFAKPPPDFGYATPTGIAHLRDLAGRTVVVNFWATWCEPCQAELDAFARMRAAYGERVVLIAISDEAPGIARASLAAHHIDATVVEDSERTIFGRYNIGAIPVTLVVGPQHGVTHVSIGQVDWPELRGAIDPLLDGAHLTPQPASSMVEGNAGTRAS